MISALKKLISDTNIFRLAYHRLRSVAAAAKAGFPANKLTVIAVTGTDGKTTTVAMISHILRSSGVKTGAVSTAFFEIDGKREPNPTQKTSVSAKKLQTFLLRLVDNGCTHVVIEASSHGLLQGRLACIRPAVSVVTNTSAEHLDYHGSMKAYIAAKGILFDSLRGKGMKVLNADDNSFPVFQLYPSLHTAIYSPEKQLKNISTGVASSRATVEINGKSYELDLPLPGSFNLKNALCAMTVAKSLGIDPQVSAKALLSFRGAGGRMERVDAGQPFSVYIDFTVTPAAYEQTLASARAIAGTHRLLVLTGSCGDRMPEKRPLVGEICARIADIVAVTNEDPYTEDPEKIIDEVFSGIPALSPRFMNPKTFLRDSTNPTKYSIRISDRLEAMRFLFSQARAGDVVLLCGKGADVTMMTKQGQIPWNEQEIALHELTNFSSGPSQYKTN